MFDWKRWQRNFAEVWELRRGSVLEGAPNFLEGASVLEFEETGGILFREYCFGEENSLSFTEFLGKLGEFCAKLGEFALAQK